jgi:hypothetical protein
MREPTGFCHGSTSARVAARLLEHIEAPRLGQVAGAETGFHLARRPDTLRAPDVAFVSNERLRLIDDPNGVAPLAPDLGVEVLAASQGPSDLHRKIGQHLVAGARSVWVVDPHRRCMEQHLAAGAAACTARATSSTSRPCQGCNVRSETFCRRRGAPAQAAERFRIAGRSSAPR